MIPATISVVIPCYGQAHFLGEAIESVLAQSHPAARIIVVDDGSPDDVAQVAGRYPAVRLLRQDNRGLSAARNAGLAECDSDGVCFLDADDRLLPNALEEGARALAAHPEAAFAWGFNRIIDRDGIEIPCEPRTPIDATYEELLMWNVVGPPVAVTFRRSMLVEEGGFSTEVSPCEDYDAYLRLARRHPTVGFAKLVAEYRRHGANVSADESFMLRGIAATLRRQESWVAGNRDLQRRLSIGLWHVLREHEETRRVDVLRGEVREGRWVSAGLSIGALVVRHPVVFWRIVRARVGRLAKRARV